MGLPINNYSEVQLELEREKKDLIASGVSEDEAMKIAEGNVVKNLTRKLGEIRERVMDPEASKIRERVDKKLSKLKE